MQAVVRNSTTRGFSPPSGWALAAQSSYFSIGLTCKQYIWVYGTSDTPTALTGTETGSITISQSSASDSSGTNFSQIYTFTGQSSVWHIESATVVETTSGQTVIPDTGVTTTGNYRRALNFIYAVTGQSSAFLAYTGQTGGTWAIDVEYQTGTPSFILQSAEMLSTGTIDGGQSTAISASGFSVAGMAIYADFLGSTVGTMGPLELPSFNSTTLSSDGNAYQLQSTLGRTFSGPDNRMVRLTGLTSTAPFFAAFGTSNIVASSSEGILVPARQPYEQHLSPSITYVSLASSTDVVVNVTLERYRE